MRFIIPNFSLPDNFAENVATALRTMGHEVITAPQPVRVFNDRVMHLMQLGYEKFFPNTLTPQEKWLLKVYKSFKPHVVLTLTQSLNEEVLNALKKEGIITVCWWGDTPANMSKQGLLCDGWDFIFIKDKYAAFKLRTLDLNAFYLPEAMNPQWHKKNFTNIDNSVLFAGNTYDYRHFLISKLLKAGVRDIKLFGNKPPRWAKPEVKQLFLNKFIVKEEKSFFFGSSLACINSTAMSEGNSLNCRAFEIAGAGALQIMEYRPAIEDCFEPEKEIVTYSTFEELLFKIDYYRKNADSALEIREAGRKRALNEHTYEKRLTTIINTINN
ncbi:CgeB family protein [Longitalea arenae]|uniref:CgeB family protein n=1 Tax=Longitalea arenae TaxID=2812558 RepID=UPI001967F953|nr:glycosyltransferase [Longitalea arenae]